MNITLVWRYQREKCTKTIFNCQYKPEIKEKVLIESDWYDGPSHYGIVTDVRWKYGELFIPDELKNREYADVMYSYENPPIASVTIYLDHSEVYEEIF